MRIGRVNVVVPLRSFVRGNNCGAATFVTSGLCRKSLGGLCCNLTGF